MTTPTQLANPDRRSSHPHWRSPLRTPPSACATRHRHPPRHALRSWARPLFWLLCYGLLFVSTQALGAGPAPPNAPGVPASLADETATSAVGGPFPVRNLSPIASLYFQFTPERALPVPRGAWHVRFDLVEANYLARGTHGEDAFLFDYELTQANLALQYGLQERLAVGLEIPLLYTWKGFLDEPIKGFEDVTGFKRTIRFERPQHLFSYQLDKDGKRALQGTSGAVGLGDVAITAKALLVAEGELAPAVAGRFAVKFPTGERDRALGSGEVDVGLGVSLEKRLGSARLYFNGGLTIPTGEPFAGTGIDSVPILAGVLTGEYHLTERFSLVLQLNGTSPPVRNTGLDIDCPIFEILAGFNWLLPGLPVVWQAGFMEDLNNTNRTADFALFMSWSMFFGHGSPTPR
jgi:hypothetical protein